MTLSDSNLARLPDSLPVAQTQLPGYFTTSEAAAALGVKRARLWQLIRRGELGERIMIGHTRLIPAAAVAAYRKPKRGPKPDSDPPFPLD